MQPVLLSAGGPAPVFTNTVRPPLAAAVPQLQMQPPPTSRSQPVGLYLCSTTHTATGTHRLVWTPDPSSFGGGGGKGVGKDPSSFGEGEEGYRERPFLLWGGGGRV